LATVVAFGISQAFLQNAQYTAVVAGVGSGQDVSVISIVGRFLEHSRIFRFGSTARGPRYFFGSADLLPRNLDRRVEVVIEVDEPELKRRIDEILRVNLEDDELAWELAPDGVWARDPGNGGFDTHQRLLELARARSEERPVGTDDLLGA
jgi:polyphosphate kinase